MPTIQVTLNEGEEVEFGQAVIKACARQMLARYVADPDGDSVRLPTALADQLQSDILEVIKAEASKIGPGIAREILAGKVVQTDKWGDPTTGQKTVKDIIAEQVRNDLNRGRGGFGKEHVLDQLIRDEVTRQIEGELKAELTEAKRVVVAAVGDEATKALRGAIAKGMGL